MKKTSLFILLILLTFSLSQSNFKLHFQTKQAYIGIRERDKIYDYISNKMNFSKEINEIFKRYLSDLEFCDGLGGGGPQLISNLNKLRELKLFNSFSFNAEHLKINKKYFIYFIFAFNVIVEKPPKYERKCKSGFLGIGKKCTNVEVAQSFSQNEIKEVIIEEIRDIIVVDAFVDLPKEDYEQYKQILTFKFPKNKILK